MFDPLSPTAVEAATRNQVLIRGRVHGDVSFLPERDDKLAYLHFTLEYRTPGWGEKKNRHQVERIMAKAWGDRARALDGLALKEGDRIDVAGFLTSRPVRFRCGHTHMAVDLRIGRLEVQDRQIEPLVIDAPSMI